METASASPGTVLFGFGYPDWQESYISMIRSGKFPLLTAGSAEEALRIFQDHPEVLLVILSAELAGSNGFEVLLQMKRSRPDIPIFLLSVKISFESIKLATLFGCNEFLQLPLQRDELITLINKYMRRIKTPVQ